jgi:hypothetical protein
MQFSLSTVMLAMLALALLLVAPALVLGLVWLLLPSLLVAMTLYGRPTERTFAMGSLVGYVAMALQPQVYGVYGALSTWLNLPLGALVLGLSGWLMLQLRRRFVGRDDSPVPPPWPDE